MIGVAKTIKYTTIGEDPQPAVYIPLEQNASDSMVLFVRSEGHAPAVLGDAQREIRSLQRELGQTVIFVTHDQQEAFMIADRVGILNQGRLEQIGRPEEIYHQPATRFVARFVGKADFLSGRVTEEGIMTEIGTLSNIPGFPEGAQVEVMVRPDHIELLPDPAGNAMILSRQFRGPDNLVVVQLPSGATIHSHQPSTLTLHPGDRAKVVAKPAHVVAFRATKPWL